MNAACAVEHIALSAAENSTTTINFIEPRILTSCPPLLPQSREVEAVTLTLPRAGSSTFIKSHVTTPDHACRRTSASSVEPRRDAAGRLFKPRRKRRRGRGWAARYTP